MIRDKHVWLCVRFRNGETQWTQMDAVKLQDPFPIIQYVTRNRLEKSPSFAWFEKIVKDEDRLQQLAHAYKAKVDHGPKYKFGVEVPRSPKHGMDLDKANGKWRMDISSRVVQATFQSTLLYLRNEPPLPDLRNFENVFFRSNRLIVAYHRPRNLRNVLFLRKLRETANQPVSSFLHSAIGPPLPNY